MNECDSIKIKRFNPLYAAQAGLQTCLTTTMRVRNMDEKQIQLIQDSWQQVLHKVPHAAELFYQRLFHQYPETRDYFSSPDNMSVQGVKLVGMISMVVNSLTRLETIIPIIQESGRRHAGYGVKLEDYDKVGSSLIWTLEQGLGELWNDEIKTAWLTAYNALSSVMKEAAAEVESV